MSLHDPLALALSEWQRKHQISDGDPMLAVLDLVRLAVDHPPAREVANLPMPPSFEEFRATMELLDTRSKAFVSQSTHLTGELRTFTQSLQRLHDQRMGRMLLVLSLGLIAGLALGALLWR